MAGLGLAGNFSSSSQDFQHLGSPCLSLVTSSGSMSHGLELGLC